MRLLVISHTPHYEYQGTISAWGSTVRELDHLADLFDELVHVAPLHPSLPPNSSLSYANEKIRFVAVRPAGGETLSDKLSVLRHIPAWLAVMKREIKAADSIHIRCPAGISLVALFAQKLWAGCKPTWVKYAGNWQPGRLEPCSYRMQRYWLKHNFHQGVVTINGSWPDQPAHVKTFNNPSFSSAELFQSTKIAAGKILSHPLNLIFVGRVDEAKGIGRMMEIALSLHNRGIDFHLFIIGDGPEKPIFERRFADQGLSGTVTFSGWMSRLEINDYYKNAHLIILPSTSSEGWPKVLSEAMGYGVVPLAADISSIPLVLSQAQAGQAIRPDDIPSYVDAIIGYTEDSARWKRESQNAVAAAKYFTYELYLDAVSGLFKKAWQIDLEI